MPCLREGASEKLNMNNTMQWMNNAEDGMWAVLRRHLIKRAAGAANGSCGLWKAPHVSQCCRWDCGVACAQMVLMGLGRDAERSSLLASLGTRSVWTIDLAMLLHRYGIRFMYCTRTVGVTEAFSTIDFYRTDFDKDARRVQSLFKAAEEAKVGAVQKAFSWRELAMLLSGYDYAAIVLVDSRYLYPACRMPTPVLAPPTPEVDDASDSDATQRGSSPLPTTTTKRDRSKSPLGEAGLEQQGTVGTLAHKSRTRERKIAEKMGRRLRRRRSLPDLTNNIGAEKTSMRRVNTSPQAIVQLSRTLSNSFRRGRQELQRDVNALDRNTDLGGSSLSSSRSSSYSSLCDDDDGDASRCGSPQVSPPGATTSGRRKRATPTFERRSSISNILHSTELDHNTPPRSPLSSLPASNCGHEHPAPVLSSPRPTKKVSLSPVMTPKRAGSPLSTPVKAGPSSPSPPASSSYCGHYIVLVGWSEAERVFIARDPSLPSPSSADLASSPGDPDAQVGICLTPEALDRARQSYGTDEDILVIDLARSRKGGVAAGHLAAAAAATALAASAASSAATASALVGLFAMAAAAATRAEASGFSAWGWRDPMAWFAGSGSPASGVSSDAGGDAGGAKGGTVQGQGDGADGKVFPEGMAEAAAKRLASLMSLAASGLKFSTVGEGGAESAAKKFASLLSLAASGLRFPTVVGDGYKNAGEARESAAESAAKKLASMLSVAASGLRFPSVGDSYRYPWETRTEVASDVVDSERERWAQRVASALEGLLEGGRRAAYTMEGLLEGGRRAAYSLRDSLADMADAPGGAGAECEGGMTWSLSEETLTRYGSHPDNLAPCSPGVILSPA